MSHRARAVSLVFAIGIALSAAPAAALEPSNMLAHYGYDVWDADSGLPQNSVETILQTRDGYLWVGTEEGLVRFDGASFEVFDTRNTKALGDDFIQTLCETRDGSLWIGTLNGLARYRDGRFARMVFGDSFEGRPVNALRESSDGALWIGSRDGLARYSQGTLTRFFHPGGTGAASAVRAIVELPGGEIWAGGRGALVRYRGGAFTRYGREAGISEMVLALAPNGAGGLWIGTPGGLSRFDAGRSVSFPLPGARDRTVRAIYTDRDGSLWVGTMSGLYGLRNDKLLRFTQANGLASNQIISILEDREGSLWLGTPDAGLNRVKDQRIANYTTGDGLPENRVWTVFEDRDASLWVGTAQGVLSRMKAGETSFHKVHDFGATVLAMAQDQDGGYWVGTRGAGLFRSDAPDGPWRAAPPAEGTENPNWVTSICPARDGSVWVAYLSGGLARFEGSKAARVLAEMGVPFTAAFSLFQDRAGDMWLATFGGGLVRFRQGRGDQIHRFTVKDGLTHDVVLSIEQDGEGIFWLGTRGGLSRFDGRHFTTYRQNEGVFHDAVQRAADDGRGYLWLTTNRGVFRVPLAELNAVAENPARSAHPVPFPTGNGMRSAECNNAQHGVALARDGRLWFATIKGLAMADPSHIEINRVPPQIVVESLTAGGRPARLGPGLELSPDQRDIEIRYTALSFRVPGAIRFKYRLDGFDTEWNDAGARRVAYYTNVPPGRYEFRVSASNEDGLWSDPKSYAAFTIRPHLWDTLGFRVAAVLAIGLLGLAAHRARVVRLRQRDRMHGELVEARLDALRAQLRPHFLFNTFSAVLACIDADPSRAKRMILQLAELLRSSLKSEPGQLVTVEEEVSILEQYASIERTRFGDRIRVEVEVDPGVRSARVPSFLLQPLVENAIKHGMKGHSGQVSISVRVAIDGRRLSLSVRDNGRGIPENLEAVKGIGLSNVARRLDALYPRQHSFSVHNRPEGGCEALVSIPLTLERPSRVRETPDEGVRRASA